MDPASRARLEPKAADARLLEAADRVDISGPTPAVPAVPAASAPWPSGLGGSAGAAYPATLSWSAGVPHTLQ